VRETGHRSNVRATYSRPTSPGLRTPACLCDERERTRSSLAWKCGGNGGEQLIDAFGNVWEERSRMTLREAMNLAREEADISFDGPGDGREPNAVPYVSRDGSYPATG
jgi:hypothetical protein